MSTDTISAHPSASLESSSKKETSRSQRHGSYAPKSISDHMSPTRTSSSPPLPIKRWHQSYSSFQTSARNQCPHLHYHPWCDDCQTLTIWAQPLPIKPTCKMSIPTFGDLKMATQGKSRCQSHSKNQNVSQVMLKRVCSTWRDEQFARAITKRTAKLAAWEALRQQVHWQHVDRGVTLPV